MPAVAQKLLDEESVLAGGEVMEKGWLRSSVQEGGGTAGDGS